LEYNVAIHQIFVDYQDACDGTQRGRDEISLRLSENKVLRKIFGPEG